MTTYGGDDGGGDDGGDGGCDAADDGGDGGDDGGGDGGDGEDGGGAGGGDGGGGDGDGDDGGGDGSGDGGGGDGGGGEGGAEGGTAAYGLVTMAVTLAPSMPFLISSFSRVSGVANKLCSLSTVATALAIESSVIVAWTITDPADMVTLTCSFATSEAFAMVSMMPLRMVSFW